MTREQIVIAWKNTDYREQLTPADRVALPAHPAGDSVLTELDLDAVIGGDSCQCLTLGCCGGFTEAPGYCTFYHCVTGQEFCTVGCS
jgi:mersacidin/lichenicidin family type 2 lantibiotic